MHSKLIGITALTLSNRQCIVQEKLTVIFLNKFKDFKVALGVCFALKSWKEYLLLFTYLITLGKDVTFPLITKFKTNRPLSYLFVNRIQN